MIRVGDILRGFCFGYFGRDSFDDKIVEAMGPDWIVAREINTGIVRLAIRNHSESWESIEKSMKGE